MQHFLTYTFYCRYINETNGDAQEFDWAIKIHSEGIDLTKQEGNKSEKDLPKVSDAIWVMVIKDDKVIVSAKKIGEDEDEKPIPQVLPTKEVYESQQVGYMDWSVEYINNGLNNIHKGLTIDNLYDLEAVFGDETEAYKGKIDTYFNTIGVTSLSRLMFGRENWKEWYKELETDKESDRSIYQVIAEPFEDDGVTVMERKAEEIQPWDEKNKEGHQKYTVVIWLEGDDPQCTNELMNGFIGMNFQIKAEGESYLDKIVTPSEEKPSEESNTKKSAKGI